MSRLALYRIKRSFHNFVIGVFISDPYLTKAFFILSFLKKYESEGITPNTPTSRKFFSKEIPIKNNLIQILPSFPPKIGQGGRGYLE
jgi:hypothetical protein